MVQTPTSSAGEGDSAYLLGPPPQYEPTSPGSDTGPPPIPGNKPARAATGPPRLHILGATWGGIVVTPEIQSMVSATQTATFDMRTLVHVLGADPLPNTVKTLSVLYQYADSPEGMCLLCTSELGPSIAIWPGSHQTSYAPPVPPGWPTQPTTSVCALGATWRGEGGAGVEILAVLYGGHRIETPSVLVELARFFDGLRGQIRMTNNFFKGDPWYNNRKTWEVYFRFGDSERVQVVTGVEDGALEVPWSRY